MIGDVERELMDRSNAEHVVVAAFNFDNQEMLLAIDRAAQTKRAPVHVEFSQAAAAVIDPGNMRSLGDNADLRCAQRTTLQRQLRDHRGEYCCREADRPGGPRGSGGRRKPDRPLRLDQQSAAINMPYETPNDRYRDRIDTNPFLARRKLRIRMAAARDRLLKKEAA